VFEHEVRAGDDFDVVEYGRVFEVDAADLAATDYSYFDRAAFCDGEFLPFIRGFGLQVRARREAPLQVSSYNEPPLDP
jgi:hypothetical protein